MSSERNDSETTKKEKLQQDAGVVIDFINLSLKSEGTQFIGDKREIAKYLGKCTDYNIGENKLKMDWIKRSPEEVILWVTNIILEQRNPISDPAKSLLLS